jgi:hypothetical protein
MWCEPFHGHVWAVMVVRQHPLRRKVLHLLRAPDAMDICQSNHPIGHFVVFSIELTLTAVTSLADAKRLADIPNACASICDHLLGHLTCARWPHHFFSSTYDTISILIFSSRYIFLMRRLSSSNSFILVIMETFMPPYLARHLKKRVQN